MLLSFATLSGCRRWHRCLLCRCRRRLFAVANNYSSLWVLRVCMCTCAVFSSFPVPQVRFGMASIPVPGKVQHEVDTGTQHFGKIGTPNQIYPGYRYTLHQNTGGAGICLERPQNPTEHSGMVRYEFNTGNRCCGKFDTTSIPSGQFGNSV